MTEIQNPKQKKPLERVLNLYFGIWDLFVIWCLGFVICGTKLQYGAKQL